MPGVIGSPNRQSAGNCQPATNSIFGTTESVDGFHFPDSSSRSTTCELKGTPMTLERHLRSFIIGFEQKKHGQFAGNEYLRRKKSRATSLGIVEEGTYALPEQTRP
jgi:hypothetical protein